MQHTPVKSFHFLFFPPTNVYDLSSRSPRASAAGTLRHGRIYPLGRNHHDHHTNCIALQGLIKSKTYLPPHPSSFPPLAGFSAVVRAAKRFLFPLHLAAPDAGCLDYETHLTRTVPREMRNGQIRVCPTGRFAREAIAGCPSQNCAVLSTVKVSVVSEISQSVKRDASQSNRVGTPATTSHRVCRCFCRSVAFLRGRGSTGKKVTTECGVAPELLSGLEWAFYTGTRFPMPYRFFFLFRCLSTRSSSVLLGVHDRTSFIV